ncbi:MAG: bifunctional UDP-N-acetylglucosamine diphosphorylase/glucosamine-1-phosphate N-acetyltransferase GlmU [Pseudomonadota bacterium]
MGGLAAVILAAGQSTRMKSKRSKVMYPLAGRPVVSWSIAAAKGCGADRVLVVRGPGQDDLREYLKSAGVRDVVQRQAFGTANAVQAASGVLASFSGLVLVLCGDVPLIRPQTLKAFVAEVKSKGAVVGVLTMTLRDPSSYGRIVRDLDGEMIRIVEDKDASEKEKEICEANSGIICADRAWLFRSLKRVGCKNAKGEFYLTDLVAAAVGEGLRAVGFNAGPPEDFLGINTRVDLANAARIMRERINVRHMLAGVGIEDQFNTTIDAGVEIGADTTIMPYSFLLGETRVGADCTIENGVVLRDAVVGDGVRINAMSIIEKSAVADGARVGPFARIRPGSKVGPSARVGNFVELKKCELKAGAKANHLTYLGDASVGARANIGCGTITCNYDGKAKHLTVIGEEAFVGSDVQFIAPVKIGRGSVIGAGSVITKDVPADSLAVTRAEQKNIKGWAKKRRGKG